MKRIRFLPEKFYNSDNYKNPFYSSEVYVEVYVNPTTSEWKGCFNSYRMQARAIIVPDGNLYAFKGEDLVHTDLIKMLGNFGVIPIIDLNKWHIVQAFLKHFLAVVTTTEDDMFDLYPAESYSFSPSGPLFKKYQENLKKKNPKFELKLYH